MKKLILLVNLLERSPKEDKKGNLIGMGIKMKLSNFVLTSNNIILASTWEDVEALLHFISYYKILQNDLEKCCKPEYVQRSVCFVNVQFTLNENVVFSVCACMGMWNSISGLDTWYHFQFNISCGVAVKVRSHQDKFR